METLMLVLPAVILAGVAAAVGLMIEACRRAARARRAERLRALKMSGLPR